MKIKASGIIVSIVMLFAITLGFIPGISTAIEVRAANDSGVCSSCGNIAWELSGTTLTISKVSGATDGDMCDECYQEWNPYAATIEKVTIKTGVTSIGWGAFDGFSGLISITIPIGVTSIGPGAFYDCGSLKSIAIPNNVTSIGNYAFYGCTNLTSVTIPAGVTTIEPYLFEGCSNLTSVVIPDSVTSIGYGAFYGCSSLTSVTIPTGVTIIGYEAFRECSSLTSIVIPTGVRNIERSLFYGCSSLTSVTIPEGVISIGGWVFQDCTSLTKVTIPKGVTSIGIRTFSGCTNLKEVILPIGLTSIEQGVFEKCKSLVSITIPAGVTSIGMSAFENCYTLTDVTLPKGLTSIGTSAFNNCEKLVRITIPEGITYIGSSAFYGCESLTDITIPEGVTGIENDTFFACSSLTGIKLPDSLTYIGEAAFDNCVSLTDVIIPNGVTSIDEYAFNNCDSLSKLTIPKSVTNMGIYAFCHCSNLTELTIASGVTSIGGRAFQSCASLTKITILAETVDLGVQAFRWCPGLTTVIMPCTLKECVSDGELFEGSSPTFTYTHPADSCMANDTSNTLSLSCPSCANTYTATLKAPAKTTYTGKPIVATCTGTSTDFAPVITYSGDKLVDGKPVYPGTYTATLSYGENASVSLKYTITEATAPAKPHKITNVVSGVHVYWTAISGVSKYGLWRSETGVNGTYKWIANPTVAHFTDTKVESGKTYYYKVTTLDTVYNVHSAKSPAIGITYVATPDITLRVNRAVGIGLGWDKISGATGYAIYRKPYSGNSDWVRIATITNPNTLTWNDTSVKADNGSVYKYTIRALAGSDSKTLSGCRTTGRTMVRLTSRDLNSAVKTGATSIKCTWGTTTQATGYEVRFMVGNTVYKTYTIGNYKTGVKTFKDLKAGQTYKIQVRTYKKVEGVGSFYSAWSTAKTVSL